jgi:aldehyde dehydrogenase (NAD+)
MVPDGVAIAHPDRLFIGGDWVPAASGREIEIVSPVSEAAIGRVAEADEADMDRRENGGDIEEP